MADTDTVIPFTDKTLAVCNEKKLSRESNKKKTKYSDIVLPEKADGLAGYHRVCYVNYTAVKSKSMHVLFIIDI